MSDAGPEPIRHHHLHHHRHHLKHAGAHGCPDTHLPPHHPHHIHQAGHQGSIESHPGATASAQPFDGGQLLSSPGANANFRPGAPGSMPGATPDYRAGAGTGRPPTELSMATENLYRAAGAGRPGQPMSPYGNMENVSVPASGVPMPRPDPRYIRNALYVSQHTGTSCNPTALAMAEAQFVTGRRPDERAVNRLIGLTGTASSGYQKGLDGIVSDAQRVGLSAQKIEYRPGDPRVLDAIDQALARGQGVICQIKNIHHTNNNHYVYLFGKCDGGYVMGDPDRHNLAYTNQPITREHLWQMMAPRAGGAVAVGRAGTPNYNPVRPISA